MGRTHLIIEAEMGCSHLLSTMETPSANLTDVTISKVSKAISGIGFIYFVELLVT